MPPKDLYSASMAAGKAAGKYSSTLADISGVGDEMSFIQREAAMNLQQQGQLFGAIGAGMELTSTVYGGWRDKQKFAGKVEAMEGKYGKMQEDKRGFAEKLFGAEKTYTFGEGEDAKTFSKAGVGATGGSLLGELSMFDESGLGGETGLGGAEQFRPDRNVPSDEAYIGDEVEIPALDTSALDDVGSGGETEEQRKRRFSYLGWD